MPQKYKPVMEITKRLAKERTMAERSSSKALKIKKSRALTNEILSKNATVAEAKLIAKKALVTNYGQLTRLFDNLYKKQPVLIDELKKNNTIIHNRFAQLIDVGNYNNYYKKIESQYTAEVTKFARRIIDEPKSSKVSQMMVELHDFQKKFFDELKLAQKRYELRQSQDL